MASRPRPPIRGCSSPHVAADEEELRRNLPGAVAAFAREVEALQGGAGAAYIHCNGGRGRAPTVVTAFLYWLAGQSLEEAAATMTAGGWRQAG